jgi:hypothetical protein
MHGETTIKNINCNCILVVTNLKIGTCVAEACLWLLCNKITFIHGSAFIGIFKSYILIFLILYFKFDYLMALQNVEHETMILEPTV